MNATQTPAEVDSINTMNEFFAYFQRVIDWAAISGDPAMVALIEPGVAGEREAIETLCAGYNAAFAAFHAKWKAAPEEARKRFTAVLRSKTYHAFRHQAAVERIMR